MDICQVKIHQTEIRRLFHQEIDHRQA